MNKKETLEYFIILFIKGLLIASTSLIILSLIIKLITSNQNSITLLILFVLSITFSVMFVEIIDNQDNYISD